MTLKNHYQTIIKDIQAHLPVQKTISKHTQAIDDFILNLVQNLKTSNQNLNFSVIALGGYGRAEMSLHSDVDLLFLHDETDLKTVQSSIEKILYPLWDSQIDIGYSVRTLDECQKDMMLDQALFTSFLEHRFLAGNSHLFKKFENLILETIASEFFRADFLQMKIDEQRKRLHRFGSSVYRLEPNIKEGEGSLRDLHLIRWLQKIFQIEGGFQGLAKKDYITKTQLQRLEEALNFFLKVRNLLHFFHKKKKDQLTFVLQVSIASELGYKDSKEHLAVESFMQDYYSLASDVHYILKILLKKIPIQNNIKKVKDDFPPTPLDDDFEIREGYLFATNSNVYKKNPDNLMKTFFHLQQHNLFLHYETLDLITQSLDAVDDDFRHNPKVAGIFKSIVSNFHNLGKTFFAMHEAKFFDTYIPEFRHLRNKVQHDIYHVYTVDTHSIFALEELSKLESGIYDESFPLFKEVLHKIKQPDILSLGLLFHDIGKGKGGNHSTKGAEMAKSIASRLGYSQKEQDDIEFLVLAHLQLSHISQRRDLEDPHLIQELAQTLKTKDRLNMLFILTWADIRAVSQKAWTEWKGTLLTTLYHKTKAVLESSRTVEQTQSRLSSVKTNLLKKLKSKHSQKLVEDFLENITPRYLIAHDDTEVSHHFELVLQHKKNGFFMEETPLSENHFTELLILTYHNPRVLSLITGAMLIFNINILALDVFSLSDGFILVKLNLQSIEQKKLNHDQFKKLKTLLENAFAGKSDINNLLQKQKKAAFLEQKPVQNIATRVEVDNDVSPYYTVIDIYTHDRVGLLYDIVRVLADQGFYVEVSKISTKVDQVVDTFYVKDIFGQRISSRSKLQEIKQALLDVCATKT